MGCQRSLILNAGAVQQSLRWSNPVAWGISLYLPVLAALASVFDFLDTLQVLSPA
jgi:hypothetical protein